MPQLSTKSLLFLFGTFLSSLGSTAFVIALLAFPVKLGLSVAIVGLTIGISRLVGVLVGFFLGPIGDYINPRKILLFGEGGALLCSILVYFSSFNLSDDEYMFFIFAVAARSFFMATQSTSINKTGKIFDEELSLNGAFAKYLNKASFGSIFFAMFINLAILRYGDFQTVIIFDFFTFLLNGILIWYSTNHHKGEFSGLPIKTINVFEIWKENRHFFKDHQKLAVLDIVLAFILMGANTLNIVLFINDLNLVPLASGVFGLAIWLSTPIEKILKIKQRFWWLILGSSIVIQGLLINHPAYILIFSFLRNVSYWIVYNQISSEIMKIASKEKFASVSSGRAVVINLVGALGEFWVGLKLFPVVGEVLWRGIASSWVGLSSNFKKAIFVGGIFMSFAISSNQLEAKEIVVPIHSYKINIDPQTMEDVTSLFINRQIHRGLMKYTSGLELTQDLVESYRILENGKRYRFILAKTHFSDGTLITSQDVVRTFRRMLKVNSAIVPDIHSIIGFDSTSKKFGVTAIDDRTVEFDLSFSDPFFLKNLAAVDCSIIKLNSNLEMQKSTSGYYAISASSTEITLSKNPYNIEKGGPQKIRFLKVDTDDDAIVKAIEGKIDTIETYNVDPVRTEALLSKGWKSFPGQTARILFLTANPDQLSFELRKKIFTVLSKKTHGFPKNYSKAHGIIPSLLPGSLSLDDISELFDPPSDSKVNQKIEISHPEGEEFEVLSQWIASALKEHGFEVKLKVFTFENYFTFIKEKKYQLVLRTKFLDYPDGMALLTYFKSNLPINTFNIGNSKVDQMISKAQKDILTSSRVESYKKIQLELLRESNFIPIAFGSSQSFLWSKRVKNIVAHPMGLHSLYFHEIELNE